jgi:hypothetical protein
MGGDRCIAVMGEFANHLDDPLVPAWQMRNDDHPWKFAVTRWASVVGLSAVAIVGNERHGFGNQGRV